MQELSGAFWVWVYEHAKHVKVRGLGACHPGKYSA